MHASRETFRAKPIMTFAAAVQRQRDFFESGATRPLEFRRAQLLRLRDGMISHESALLEALHSDLRKSPQEAYASELGFVRGEIDHMLRRLPRWMRKRRRRVPRIVWPARAFTRPEPRGVSLIIGPWNYPLQLLLSPLAGAIAAGNCALVKPSEFAPRTSAAISRLLRDAFAEEYIKVVPGEKETSQALLQEKFDTIFFTGSTAVGREVMKAAARHLTPVTLELGGKCPCLIAADAPLETTARRIAWGKFLNAGQTCVAPDYLLVDRAIRDDLIAALKNALGKFYGENPQESADYGRIVNRRHFDRLRGYLTQGHVAHGGRMDADDLYLEPTLLTDVPAGAPVMREEIFGPILPVLDFGNLDQALGIVRERPVPLALYLFTRDRAVQDKVLAESASGGVCLNDTISHLLGKDLPFGGRGESGMGTYHGRASFDCFSHHRPVLNRSPAWDPGLQYPPARISLKALKRILRYLLDK